MNAVRNGQMMARALALAALLVGSLAVATPASAVPSTITFPLSVAKSVIQSQSPLKWCYTSQTNCHRYYNAADIFAPTGTPVVSPVAGTVIRATTESTSVGSRVQIRDGDGNIWYLAHMHHSPGLRVTQGQQVQRGTPIGNVGTSAHAVGTQPHLHIDMLPPPYTSRPTCSSAECTAFPFVNLQPLLVAAFNNTGYREWRNLDSGKCLGVTSGDMTNGTKIVQWTCNGNPDQSWQAIPLNDNSYHQLRNKANPNKCIGVPGGSQTKGVQLVIWDCNSNPDQKWNAKLRGSGCYSIENLGARGLFIAIAGASPENGAAVVQWPDENHPDQRWC